MKTTILVSTFGLLLGCNPSDRAARHEEKATEQRQEAQKDLVKGREEANKDLAKAREEANKDLDKAHEQDIKAQEDRAKAAEDRREERRTDDMHREPVVGREDGMIVHDTLKDKLGDDWMVDKAASGWLAIRKVAKKADKDMSKKLIDEQKNLRDDHKNASATYAHGEVILRGSVDDCDDIGKSADKFGKIDGVNKILVEMSCNKK
jgi:hypothetical protein